MVREPRGGGGAEAQEGVPPATADMGDVVGLTT